MSGSDADIYVAFGADQGDLEAALALAKSNVKELSGELRKMADEMRSTGAAADSELAQHMKSLGAELVEAKERVSSFKKELHEEEGGNFLEAFSERLHGLFAPLEELKSNFGEIGEAVAAAFAVEKLVEFVREQGEMAEQAERTAKTLGMSIEQVAQLNFIATMTGTPVDSLTQTMSRFELSLSKAAAGTGTAAAGLKALGVDAKELIGLPLPQQLEHMAEAISTFADGTNKTAALSAINRSFVELLPLLDQGKEGFDELKAKLLETNSTLDEATNARLVHMNEGFKELGAAVHGVENEAFIPFIDVVNGAVKLMTDLAESFTESVKEGGLLKLALELVAWTLKHIEQFIAETILGFKNLYASASSFVMALIAGFEGMGDVFREVFVALGQLVPAFFTALVEAGRDAVDGVGRQFVGLGAVIADTFKFNFGAAKEAFAGMERDASDSLGRIAGHFTNLADFSKASEAASRTADAMNKEIIKGNEQIATNAKKGGEEYAVIWGESAKHAAEEMHKSAVPNLDLPNKEAEKSAKDALAAAMEAAQGQVKLQDEATKQQISAIASLARMHEITEDQKVQMTEAALQRQFEAQQAELLKELQLQGLSLAQRQKITDQMRDLAMQNARDIQKIQQEGIEKTVADWKSGADTIAGLLDSQVSGVLKGTTSIGQAFKNMAASAIEDIIKFLLKWGVEHAATIAMNILGIQTQTAATIAATAAQGAAASTASATNAALQNAQKITTVTADAGVTAAGVTAYLAPFLGPAAIPAGQAAGAEVMAMAAMDIGAWNVPQDQIAMIHKNELVATSSQADAIRSIPGLLSGLSQGGIGAPGGGGGAGAIFHIHTIDAQGVAQWLSRYGQQLAQTVSGQFNAQPSTRPTY